MTEEARPSRLWIEAAAVAALALLGAGFLFEMVATGAVPVARDVQLFFIPHKHILWQALQDLEIPLWTPLIRTGYPVLANFQSGVFYPPHWLYAAVPFLTGFNLLVVLHLVLGGVGTYALGRRLDFGPAAAWIAAVSFMLGGYFASLTNLINALQAAAWAPAMVAVLVHHVRRWRPATLAGLVTIYALGFLAGAPQTFLLASAMALVFTVVWCRDRPDPAQGVRRTLASMAVAAAAVAGLTAVQVLPTLEMVSHAGRGAGLSLEESGRYSLEPVRLLHLVVANDFTDPVYRFGRKLQLTGAEPWLYSVYLGLPTLVLAWHARWDRGRRGQVVTWSVLALVGVVLALGAHTPVFGWLHAHLPGFSAFRFPEKFFVLPGLAVPMLAAHGTSGLLDRPPLDDVDRGAALLALTGGLAALAGWVLAPDAVHGWFRARLPEAPLLDHFPFAYVEWGENLEVALAVLTAAVVVAGLYRKEHLGKATGVAVLCLLVPLDFWLANRTVNPVVDDSFYTRRPPVQETLAMDELQRTYRYRATPYEEHLGTFYSFPDLSVEAAKWLWQQTMQPASGALWDVQAHDAMDAIHLRPILATDSLLRRGPEQRRRRLLRLGSVKYVYHSVASADLPRSMVVRLEEVPGFVFRLEETLPRAYLAHGERARSRAEAIDSILEPSAPYRRRAMISGGDDGPVASGRFSGELAVPGESPEKGGGERPGPPPGEAAREDRPADAGRESASGAVGSGSAGSPSRIDPLGDLPDPGSAEIVEDTGERIRIRVDPDTTSYLVLTDTWYPGWRARVDGEERPVRRANHFFKAVRVRPGDETVVFRYRSEPLRQGAWVSAGSFLLLATGLLGWAARRRRDREPDDSTPERTSGDGR